MSSSWSIKLLVGMFLAVGIIVEINILTSKPKNDHLIDRINELESKIDSIYSKKDSIKFVIDSTHVKIITNEKHYEKVVNTIMSQPYSSDSQYVTDYIRQYCIKNNLFDIR